MILAVGENGNRQGDEMTAANTSVGVPIFRTLRPIYEKTLVNCLAFHGR